MRLMHTPQGSLLGMAVIADCLQRRFLPRDFLKEKGIPHILSLHVEETSSEDGSKILLGDQRSMPPPIPGLRPFILSLPTEILIQILSFSLMPKENIGMTRKLRLVNSQ